MSGSTASQHASTSRPFIRTAQVPHIFEPQNQRYARSGAPFSAIQFSASSTRIHLRYGTLEFRELAVAPERRTRTVIVIARRKARIAGLQRVLSLGLAEPARPSVGQRAAHQATSRLFRVAKSGLKNGSFVRPLLEPVAVVGADHNVGGEPARVVLQREVAPHERSSAFLAFQRRQDDQFADIDHVDRVDGVEPFIVGGSRGPGRAHARQQVEPEVLDVLQGRPEARRVLLDADLLPHHRANGVLDLRNRHAIAAR